MKIKDIADLLGCEVGQIETTIRYLQSLGNALSEANKQIEILKGV